MILTCPSCGTQYAVKDGAIPAGGRKVRCAACGHSWHQDPDSAPSDGEAPQTEAAAPSPETPATDAVEADQPGVAGIDAEPAEPMQAYEEIQPIAPGAPLVEPPAAVPVPPPDDTFGDRLQPPDDQWDLTREIPDAEELDALRTETGADRKRNWLMAIFLAMALVVALAVAFWFLAPDSLRQQIGLAAAPTPLQIAPGTPERRALASGNELVVVSGRVINPSSRHQTVPPIEAQLRDQSGRLVHEWTIPPPARTLAPGGSAPFNSAKTDIPATGLNSTVTLTLKG